MILVYRDLYAMTLKEIKKGHGLEGIWQLPITDISDMAVAIGMGIMMLNKQTDQILVCDAFMGNEHKRVEFFACIENGRVISYRQYMEDQLVGEGLSRESHFKSTLKTPTKYVWKGRVDSSKVASSILFSSNQALIKYVEDGSGSRFRMPVR